MDAAAYCGLRVVAATGLPTVSMARSSFRRVSCSSWSRIAVRRALAADWRCSLDEGEGGLLLFGVAVGGECYEAVDQLFVGDAGGLPEFRIHADAGEARHGVDFVEVDAGGFRFAFFLCFDGRFHEEVDTGEASAVAGTEGGDGHFAYLFRL